MSNSREDILRFLNLWHLISIYIHIHLCYAVHSSFSFTSGYNLARLKIKYKKIVEFYKSFRCNAQHYTVLIYRRRFSCILLQSRKKNHYKVSDITKKARYNSICYIRHSFDRVATPLLSSLL